jgi:hypothetical protein
MDFGKKHIVQRYRMDKAIASTNSSEHIEIRHQVVCPVCGNRYSHTRFADDAAPDDPDTSRWQWLTEVNFWGECGHMWEICFGDHNGRVYVFARVRADDPK